MTMRQMLLDTTPLGTAAASLVRREAPKVVAPFASFEAMLWWAHSEQVRKYGAGTGDLSDAQMGELQ